MYSIGNQGKIMRKLLVLGKQSATESANDPGVSSTSSPTVPQLYRPSTAQNAVYTAGNPIKCIDISPDRHAAILGGPYILKTVKIDGVHIREGVDLRSIITAHHATKAGAASSVGDQLAIRDVKWTMGQNSQGQGSPMVFTACANGKIFQYDLARAGSSAAGGTGLEFIQIREDARQINSLDINPHRGSLLLSGSQDGIARCFDTRTPIQTRTGLTFRAISPHPFRCNADSVRQVKWSPTDGFYFACSTDQGVVLKWDIRKHVAPILKIKAHDKICSSLDWHPDGEHLVSAGWDGKCHVWDMSRNADKRQKAKWSISTPAPVSVAVWRPGQWSATAQGRRAAQIAVSYEDSSQKRHGINAVHIWDLARPTMPYKEIQRFDNLPTAMIWQDRDLLWTAGQDGLFNQCDTAFAPKVIDRQTVSTMAFSARGDVLMFLDERSESHRPRAHIVHKEILPTSSYGSSPNTPMLSISRSDSEDDIVGSFLGPRRRGSRRRRLGSRSAHVLSSTPPSGTGEEKSLSLEQAINLTGIFKSQQARVFGHVPAAASVDVYGYLSTNYLEILDGELPQRYGQERPMVDRIASILERYAKAAENITQFRLAQSWRILAYGMNLLLRRRAQFHLGLRMRRLQRPGKKSEAQSEPLMPVVEVDRLTPDGDEMPHRAMSAVGLDKASYARSLLSEEIESTSNVPTPLARPVRDDRQDAEGHTSPHGKKLTPILEPDSFSLPPALHAVAGDRRRLNSMPLSTVSHDSERTTTSEASTEGYSFYDAEALLSKAIDVPSTRRTGPSMPRDYMEAGSPSIRRPALRHDSDESFSQLFSVSDSSRRNTGLAGSSDGGSLPRRSKLSTVPQLRNRQRSDSNASDMEFESRIRGQKLAESPVRTRLGALHLTLDRSETGLTSFTDEHHMITQTTSGSFTSQQNGPADEVLSDSSPEKRAFHAQHTDSFTSEDERLPYIIEEDYLPWLDDPPYPHPLQSDGNGFSSLNPAPPIDPYTLVSRALEFEARSSALNASAMILLLKPLLPSGVIDTFQAAAILRQHHSRLMSMKLFVEAALLRKLCLRGWPGGILSIWGEDYTAIFTPAQQGVQAGFFCSDCHKPRDIDRSSASMQSIWRCERCKTVMAPCAVCGHRDATVNPPSTFSDPADLANNNGTGESKATREGPVLSTWWYCPGCGHGGHSTCLQGWHGPLFEGGSHHLGDYDSSLAELSDYQQQPEFSDGCCPLDGCGHACLPGRGRMEAAAARTEEVSRAVREVTRAGAGAKGFGHGASGSLGIGSVSGNGSGEGDHHRRANTFSEFGVRGDLHEVLQSRAVESVRETLAVEGSSSRDVSGKALSSSPGRGGNFAAEKTGSDRERRKSVKFVASTEGGK